MSFKEEGGLACVLSGLCKMSNFLEWKSPRRSWRSREVGEEEEEAYMVC